MAIIIGLLFLRKLRREYTERNRNGHVLGNFVFRSKSARIQRACLPAVCYNRGKFSFVK